MGRASGLTIDVYLAAGKKHFTQGKNNGQSLSISTMVRSLVQMAAVEATVCQ
jgi:hypothetical protein